MAVVALGEEEQRALLAGLSVCLATRPPQPCYHAAGPLRGRAVVLSHSSRHSPGHPPSSVALVCVGLGARAQLWFFWKFRPFHHSALDSAELDSAELHPWKCYCNVDPDCCFLALCACRSTHSCERGAAGAVCLHWFSGFLTRVGCCPSERSPGASGLWHCPGWWPCLV